jgi:uncharacterized protein YecE (DUF72 family)
VVEKPLVYVGTSGWTYSWNEGGDFKWYVENSGLNAVELNASFYRFPFSSQIAGWAKKGGEMRWAIKVHRTITHLRRLSENSYETWFKFRNLFSPMEKIIDFYLFQLPPSFSCREEMLRRIERFEGKTELGERMAVEFRDPSCYNNSILKWAEEVGITLVSVDSPEATWIVRSTSSIYLRLHGRSEWYFHNYTYEELHDLARKVFELMPERIYVFFNNDHWMLENAKTAMNLFSEYRTSSFNNK